MKKIFFTLFATLVACTCYGQTVGNSQMELVNFKEVKGDFGELFTRYYKDWPRDDDNRYDCACVRISFENMSMSDAKDVIYTFSSSAPKAEEKNRLNEKEHEWWVFVSPSENAYMEASHPKFGKSNRLSGIKLEAHKAYDVVLRNNKTVSISVHVQPTGATVSLSDIGVKSTAPATFADVPFGNHTLVISVNGQQRLKETIEVSETNTTFERDVRERKSISFTSDPKGAILFIDGEKVGSTPYTCQLPYGAHTVEARLSSDANKVDKKSFEVNAYSDPEIKLEPVRKKTFEVIAMYNGRKVNADLYVDGSAEGIGKSSYTLTEPVGRSVNVRMSYNGNAKKRKIKVTNNMSDEQIFKIAARNSIVWPWQRDYNSSPVGLSMGYVSKQLVTQGEGEKLKENGFWPDGEGCSLSGMQFGIHFQPCFSFGLGMYTGLFYELYMSWNDNYDYNRFLEHCVYVPAHALFRIPFSENIALILHGGLGFNYAIYGAFSDSNDYYEDLDDMYGEAGYPKRFNLTAEIAAGFRIGHVMVQAQYAKGLNNHKSYSDYGDYKTRQNKLSFSVSYMFTSE